MTGVVDEYEGLLPATVPVINDGVPQVTDRLTKGLEVGVCDLKDIHAACSESHYSSTHIPCVIFDLVDVSEAVIPWHVAQNIVAPVLNNDPLVMVGSEVCFYHPVFLYFFGLIVCSNFIIIILA